MRVCVRNNLENYAKAAAEAEEGRRTQDEGRKLWPVVGFDARPDDENDAAPRAFGHTTTFTHSLSICVSYE